MDRILQWHHPVDNGENRENGPSIGMTSRCRQYEKYRNIYKIQMTSPRANDRDNGGTNTGMTSWIRPPHRNWADWTLHLIFFSCLITNLVRATWQCFELFQSEFVNIKNAIVCWGDELIPTAWDHPRQKHRIWPVFYITFWVFYLT